MTGPTRHWPRYVGALIIAIVMAGTATAFATISAIPAPLPDPLQACIDAEEAAEAAGNRTNVARTTGSGETTPRSTPGATPKSTPGTTPRSTPGTTPKSTPGTAPTALPPGCADIAPPLPDIPDMTPVEPGKPQTLLLIGSDKRSKTSIDGGQRTGELSDTMMLAHLDGDRGGALLSIPRDTQVQIPLEGGGSRTAKVNEAFAEGGAPTTVKAIKGLLGVKIHHVVVINFSAFERAINKLGCLYQDIDRSYFNDNSNGENYAAIDVKAGYQMLCGADTLDWVRYRHADNDLVRAARQQEFLRAAKTQIAASKIVDNRNELFTIFNRYTRTDIRKRTAVLSLLKLALNASDKPLRSVKFRAVDVEGTSNLAVTPNGLRTMKREFEQLLPAKGATTSTTAKPQGKTSKGATKKRPGIATGLVRVGDEARNPELARASFSLAARQLPVYYPSVRLGVGGYAQRDPVRTYSIRASRFSKKVYPAFRLTFSAGEGKYFGQYYGLQGTTWKDAPILMEPHTTVRRRNRTLNVYPTGGRYRIVSWTTDEGVYWISNSVSLALGNKQMLDIASSLVRVPG